MLGIGISADGQGSPGAGRIERFQIQSAQYGRARTVWIYTPRDYSSRVTNDLIIAFDGADYQQVMPLPRVLDSLAALKKIAPSVAVLIDDSASSERIAELGNSPRFAKFLGDEVVPWVRKRWTVTRDPHRTTLTGSSAGGLAAAYVALQRPDLFGNVFSQSGAFWRGFDGSNGAPYEYLASAYGGAAKADIRFVLDVGERENHATLGGSGPNFLEATRRFHAVLKEKGYDVTYAEVPGGEHSPESWGRRLGDGLVAAARPRG